MNIEDIIIPMVTELERNRLDRDAKIILELPSTAYYAVQQSMINEYGFKYAEKIKFNGIEVEIRNKNEVHHLNHELASATYTLQRIASRLGIKIEDPRVNAPLSESMLKALKEQSKG